MIGTSDATRPVMHWRSWSITARSRCTKPTLSRSEIAAPIRAAAPLPWNFAREFSLRDDCGRRDWKTPIATAIVLSAAMRAAGRRLFVALVVAGDMPDEHPQARG